MLSLMVCCVVGFVQAGSIPLTNAGFEQPATGKITGFDTGVPGWSDVGTNADSGVEGSPPWWGVHSGDYAAFFESYQGGLNLGAYQMTGYKIRTGDIFKVGFWATNIWDGSSLTVTLFGGNVGTPADELGSYTATVGTGSGGGGGVYNYFEVEVPATSGSVGKELGIKFVNPGTTENWVGLDDVTLEETTKFLHAFAPDPSDGETGVERNLSGRMIAGNLSWTAPNDPNIVEIKGYDLYLDPNDVKVSNRVGSCLIAANTAAGVTQYDPISDFDYLTTYYWVVDTRYTRDDDPNVGTPNEQIFVGSPSVWSFETVSAAPVIGTYNSVVVTESMLPASLSAVVTDSDNNLSSAAFTLLTNDVDFPTGATAYLQNENVTNPYAPSVELVADTPGYYKIRLVVEDASGNVTVDRAEVAIYDDSDACAAAQFAPSWTGFNPMDFDTDCDVDLADFAAFALQWLNDQSLTAPENYDWYIPYLNENNGIPNGDFESGDFAGGYWVADATITTVEPIEGYYSAEWTVDADGSGIVAYQTVKASTNYEFSVQISGGATGTIGGNELLVRYYGDLGNAIAQAVWTPTTPPAVQTVTIPFTTSASDEGATLEFVIYGVTEGTYYKVDDLRLVEVP